MALIKKASGFLSEVQVELSKVSWPDIDSLKSNTWVTIVFSIFFALYIFGIDKILNWLVLLLY